MLISGDQPPPYLLKVSQQYDNLHESPLLFYFAVLLAYQVLDIDFVLLALCWLYVAFRIVHLVIHTGSNRVLQRGRVFIASYLILTFIWLWIMIKSLQI